MMKSVHMHMGKACQSESQVNINLTQAIIRHACTLYIWYYHSKFMISLWYRALGR